MGRRATGQILISPDREGGTTFSLRFRGNGYPHAVILLGSSRDGWTRSRAEHEAQIVAAQIRAGTWMPPPKPEYAAREPWTFRKLATDHYHRKRRKGLRPNSLTDMLNKLQLHLLPFFGEYHVDAIDEQLIEDYIEHKQRENDRLATAASIGRPFVNKAGRPHRPVKGSTINTHLHLLAGILDRAVREGAIPRNPARGEDLRLAVRREKRYGLELDEAWSLIEAAGDLDRQPTKATGCGPRSSSCGDTASTGRRSATRSAKRRQRAYTTHSELRLGRFPSDARSSPRSRWRGCASASCVLSTVRTSTSLTE